MIDLLICSVPAGIINRPPAAPALLKGCVVQSGFSAKTVDFSLMLFSDFCDSDYDRYEEINRLFESNVEWKRTDIISAWLEKCLQTIEDASPKFLAISVFSVFQHRSTFVICQEVKKRFPDLPIILGGYGLPEKYKISFNNFCDAPMGGSERFGDFMQRKKLVDFVVYGEGEQQLVDIVAGKTPVTDLVNIENVPFSNFDDYNLAQYLWHNEPVLTITGSKGCVRKCKFCNVPRKFGRYRQRSGKRIALEMIELSQQYNVYKFEFTDSLVNGSLKEFMQMIQTLADYNSQADQPVTWYGQYICRPQNQIPAGMYELIKKSGCRHLIIGAESGSDAVLDAMDKKITINDIFDELDQFEKHDLQCQLLVLIGFYNETWNRFLETLQFICRCHRYIAAGVISRIAPGVPLIVEEDGFLHEHAEELGIVLDSTNTSNWHLKDDTSFTWIERNRRKSIMHALLMLMNVSMTGNGIQEIKQLIEKLTLYEQQLTSPDSNIDPELFEHQSH